MTARDLRFDIVAVIDRPYSESSRWTTAEQVG
jgi:hypothetical protein